MSLTLNQIIDPRDNLNKAHRYELWQYAQSKGVKEITHEWPADLMRAELRARGYTDIKIPNRIFGQPESRRNVMQNSNGKPLPVEAQTVPEVMPSVDAIENLKRQFFAQPAEAPEPEKQQTVKQMKVVSMAIYELRAACKANGIKLTRKTNMIEMRKLLQTAGIE